MMTVTQTTRLIAWVIVGLIILGILLFLFDPVALRTDEMTIIGLLIIGLIWFQAGSVGAANEIRTPLPAAFDR